MEEYVSHPTFNFWCACHRSDLAMEDVIRCVLELNIWKSSVVAISTYYRTKELKVIIPKMKSFPVYHEVRFAQHLIQPCKAVLSNIDGCRLHWPKIIDAPREEYDGKEKDKARGFLKTWHASSLQTWLTTLVVDICSVFSYVEKECEKKDIILPDVLRYVDVAVQTLKLMDIKPYPGKHKISFITTSSFTKNLKNYFFSSYVN